jgi:hypothetical protein
VHLKSEPDSPGPPGFCSLYTPANFQCFKSSAKAAHPQQSGTSSTTGGVFFSAQQGFVQSAGHLCPFSSTVQQGFLQSAGHLLSSIFSVQHALSQFVEQSFVFSAAVIVVGFLA